MNLEESLYLARTDNSAFKEIYDLTINRVYSFVLLRTKDKETALDICQNIYLSFWQSLGKFRYMGDPHFYAFLFTIARREISREWRGRSGQTVDIEQIFDIPADPEEHEDYRLLLKELENLKEEERLCLELRYFEDLKFKDVGETLGISENYAKVLHHRAIKKLQQKLKNKLEIYEKS